MYFIIFKNEENNLWYWKLHTDHHQTIAAGAEGYISKQDVQNGIRLVKNHAPFCRTYDKEHEKWEL